MVQIMNDLSPVRRQVPKPMMTFHLPHSKARTWIKTYRNEPICFKKIARRAMIFFICRHFVQIGMS